MNSEIKKATVKQQIIDASLSILEENPEGIRFSEIAKKLGERLTDVNKNSIPGYLVKLETIVPEIYKPVKGIFRLTKYKKSDDIVIPVTIKEEKVKEQQFYEPFAQWLVDELEDCSKAISLGGAVFKDKWGTPDVIGVLKKKPTDIFDFPPEIVTAEIKVNTNDLITAFGQACSYKLFSHRVYIVVPEKSLPEDISRLDSLCLIVGLGLILFNAGDADHPTFTIKTRAATHMPDMFYVNKYLKPIADKLLS